MPCTRHRVFLATLIVASKYLNDSSPKNKHWREHAVLFDVVEINLMEKQLLLLLEYDLHFDEVEACKHFAPFMAASSPRRRKQQQEQDANMRAAAVDKVNRACKARTRAQIDVPVSLPREAMPPSAPPPSIPTSSSSSTLASAVRGLTKRLSTTHLASRPSSQQQSPRSPCPALRTANSAASTDSASSSDIASLLDDNGSSSSEFTSASEGECDEDVDDESSGPLPRKVFLRAVRSPAHRHLARNRNVSDTSSIRSIATITGRAELQSPTTESNTGSRYGSTTMRTGSVSFGQSVEEMRSGRILPSATMPSISLGRQTMSVGFLSRMWGAATKYQGHDRDKTLDVPQSGGHSKTRNGPIIDGEPAALRKIVHKRSTVFRGGVI